MTNWYNVTWKAKPPHTKSRNLKEMHCFHPNPLTPIGTGYWMAFNQTHIYFTVIFSFSHYALGMMVYPWVICKNWPPSQWENLESSATGTVWRPRVQTCSNKKIAKTKKHRCLCSKTDSDLHFQWSHSIHSPTVATIQRKLQHTPKNLWDVQGPVPPCFVGFYVLPVAWTITCSI